jgi:hypothetical protein
MCQVTATIVKRSFPRAGFHCAFPAWETPIVHLPSAWPTTAVSTTAQISGVALTISTGRPAEALTLAAKASSWSSSADSRSGSTVMPCSCLVHPEVVSDSGSRKVGRVASLAGSDGAEPALPGHGYCGPADTTDGGGAAGETDR